MYNESVLAGNMELLTEQGVSVIKDKEIESYLEQGCTVIYIAINGTFAGYIVLADTVRGESVGMIDALHKIGVPPVLLTGDNEKAASAIAKQLHIEEVHANCLPEDKLHYIEECENTGCPVCMIGDGINDAPALKKAAVGIARCV